MSCDTKISTVWVRHNGRWQMYLYGEYAISPKYLAHLGIHAETEYRSSEILMLLKTMIYLAPQRLFILAVVW